jgi:hypothetical protein
MPCIALIKLLSTAPELSMGDVAGVESEEWDQAPIILIQASWAAFEFSAEGMV